MENLTKDQIDEIKKEIASNHANFIPTKSKKEYSLSKGTIIPNKGIGIHCFIIGKAIETLIDEGISKANRDLIMDRAEVLGLYEIKPSKSNTTYIFSWWKKALENSGYIS